ncbi:MAG: AarF/ABC1/UbiB kinase family protein [Bacteroidetes bacterium]|nr:AarF/ABC1/UbiB kinase family protein [Bacteroidota bacterium]
MGTEVAGSNLAAFLEALGPTFVKFGQILSSRPDLLPPAMIHMLSRLQDATHPAAWPSIRSVLEKEIGRPMDHVFAHIVADPVASGSIAQVHRAVLRSGEAVAVKVRRPGVEAVLTADLMLMRGVASVCSRFPGMKLVPLSDLICEFSDNVAQQLDFVLEAENCRTFGRNFSENFYVKVPRLFDEFCSESVLVMEFIDDLVKIDSTELDDAARAVCALISLRAIYSMIFSYGFVHADMHPGNIFFRSGCTCVLLDFGLVARLSDDEIDAFRSFFYAMVTNGGKECAQILQQSAPYHAPWFHYDDFEIRIVDLVDHHFGGEGRDFDVVTFSSSLFRIQRGSGLRGTTRFIMTILSLLVFQGVVKQLWPRIDFQREAINFLDTTPVRFRMPNVEAVPRR